MKKTIAILLVLALALLCAACGPVHPKEGTTAPTGANTNTNTGGGETTAEPAGKTANSTHADPDNPLKAAMEPLQGGGMLYTFAGAMPCGTALNEESGEEYPVYPIGLIDQSGKLVSPPVYENTQYIYDQAGLRVTGLVAQKEQAFTLYQLSGEAKTLSCQGYRIVVYPGGKYATVQTLDSQGGSEVCDGLFDLANDRYVMEPKDGQLIQYRAGDVALGYQYKTKNLDNENMAAQWAFRCADESVIDLPLSLGRVQEYYPETGWFGAMLLPEYRTQYYDKDLKLLTGLTGWSIYPEGFIGGAYCRLYNNNDFPGVETWANRQGEVADLQVEEAYIQNVAQCYIAGPYFGNWSALYDANAQKIRKAGEGEHFAILWSEQSRHLDSFLLLDSAGKIAAAFDGYGKPFAKTGAFQSWHALDGAFVYALTDGDWRALNLKSLAPEPDAAGREGHAIPLALNGDYAVVQTGWAETSMFIADDIIAVDWQGKPYANCPLEPYFGSLKSYANAGEQGPGYFWVELGGKRGYVDTKGAWVFMDETGM